MATPRRWAHGRDDWLWLDALECWYSHRSYFCLGDRMFHQAYGRTKDDIRWHGSYSEDWHGGIQTDAFDRALAWLQEANGSGHDLW